ncbi:MAG TPA: PPC domain-containing DNA-binding protein [Burkholderiales bacterium]
MRMQILSRGTERSFALVFETGEEPVELITTFAAEHHTRAARFSAIGAFSDAVLGYFDWQKKDYEKIRIAEQVEVLSLLGDIALADGKPKLHAHVVLGKRDGTAHGGHLLEARVRPTLEVILTESPSHLERVHDPETGLPLIRIGS